ncbi:alkaline dihydroceramidase Ydc1 [Lecanosticta acicola]|uniref:Alkaline dihydroceramidase Ydc1 n=1 Tax=Lecanosticta acicola TaxID=111012 RepID=A0AAI9E9T2_9PEZI|nr:alkaline dihydroceramidase Ydc1 [Lecanosticta acicola]
MPSWLPSIPYGPEKEHGFWTPHTATIDWCEENYYATPYAAEIVNTLTNLLFMWLAFEGMLNCYRHSHDRIFFVTFAGYLLVGSGSFAFHATLKYPWQLVDELSMIYTTCLMTWASMEHSRPLGFKILVGVIVFGLAVFITLYYHYLQDPTFHQNAYAILTAFVLLRSMYMMEMNIRPYFRKRHVEHERVQKSSSASAAEKAEEQRQDDRDRWILKKMWTIIAFGMTVFLGGYGIWNLDNMYCQQLRGWRREIGLPWGVLLEGHGWWHLGTGLGAYYYIVWGVWLRHCLNGRQDEYDLHWPRTFSSIPRIVRKQPVHQNGLAKKMK